MKALTIKQPWAQLIVDGIKDIENRSWKTNFRGRIYIHSAKSNAFSYSDLSLYLTYDQFESMPVNNQHDLTHGIWNMSAIIGEVDIVDCVNNSKSIWAEEQFSHRPFIYHWVLANPIKYEQPILNVKGALSFWQPQL